MQMMFDRYAPCGGARHVDLATGRAVEIGLHDVPDDGWRRRWRVRTEALLSGCDGLEQLLDAGEAGAERVFEVRAVRAGHARPVDPRRALARQAVAWLSSRNLSCGPCRGGRLLPDGCLAADIHTAWPIETAGERRAASRALRRWRALVGCGHVPAAPRDRLAPRYAAYDDAIDRRAGLVEQPMDAGAALAFARMSGRVAVGPGVDPFEMTMEQRRRSCVVIDLPRASCAAWSAALAAAG